MHPHLCTECANNLCLGNLQALCTSTTNIVRSLSLVELKGLRRIAISVQTNLSMPIVVRFCANASIFSPYLLKALCIRRQVTIAVALKILEGLVARFGVGEEKAGDVVEILLDMTLEVRKELGRVAGTPEGEAYEFDVDQFPFRGAGSLEGLLRARYIT